VAQIEDASCKWEFHNIIGKECINDEVHYLVDWVKTLVRGHVLRKAQVQPAHQQLCSSMPSSQREGEET
jgi:hypothetical protein